LEKANLFGIQYSITNYADVTKLIIEKSILNQSFSVSALAVHGLVESVRNPNFSKIFNTINLIVPDGQPIRWCLNHFYKLKLSERVYGPRLTLSVLESANKLNLKIYLFGSNEVTLINFQNFIIRNFPRVIICGTHIDRFREATEEEDLEDINKINCSGANIVLVGRGCPRQEVWVANHTGKIKAVMIAVGAAFDFLSGTKKQAPRWMQDSGLEWLFRLVQEPKRLWKRYFFTNSYYIYLFLKHKFILKSPN